MKKDSFIIVLLSFIILCGFAINRITHNTAPNISIQKISFLNNKWIVDRRVDLQGEKVILPDSIDLVFGEYGVLCNGCVVGTKTRIEGKKYHVFENIELEGSWIVPFISSDLFSNISVSTLVSLFNLASSSISNTVFIGDGIYPIKINKDTYDGIKIPSNTEVILNGTIQCEPNPFKEYHILHLSGENIVLYGHGEIVGERNDHLENLGEWGHGIFVSKASNVTISDVKVRDCWGDCIYIGNNSKNIVVNNCYLSNSRRQGISITSADTVKISNTLISNVGGTAPEYAIDVEPNAKGRVEYVKLENVTVLDCKGGFESTGKAKDAHIGTIEISNCKVIGTARFFPFMFRDQEKLIMEDCYASTTNNKNVEIRIERIKRGKLLRSYANGKSNPVIVMDCPNVVISSNN